jgi:hypothetical protein
MDRGHDLEDARGNRPDGDEVEQAKRRDARAEEGQHADGDAGEAREQRKVGVHPRCEG